MGYYMRKLAIPTNPHYGYVNSILVSAFIEPRFMLLGGSGIFRIASELFKSVKLKYWSRIMDNYVEILEKEKKKKRKKEKKKKRKKEKKKKRRKKKKKKVKTKRKKSKKNGKREKGKGGIVEKGGRKEDKG